ncbi:thioredoxin family protein [Halobacteriaceae archaeon GCM10025711]
MGILSDDDKEEVRKALSGMDDEVTVYVFTQDGCDTCEDTVALNEELVELADGKIDLQVEDLDSEAAEEFDAAKHDNAPVSIITNGNGLKGVQYFGIPAGYEFSSFLEDIISISNDEVDLDESIIEEVKAIDEEVNIKVFVTPTCPYCPQAVRTAHKFAMVNDNITGEMVESQSFQELAQQFGVRSVPQINVNDEANQFTGALPDEQYLDEVKKALQ